MYLNSSRAGAFWRCMRRWAYEYFLHGGGYRKDQEEEHFLVGRAFHHGAALFYLGKSKVEAVEAAAKYYLDERTKHWGMALAEWAEDVEWIKRFMNAYISRDYPKDDFTVEDVEQTFIVPLGEICYECGEPYPDGVLTGGEYCVCGAEVHFWVGTSDLLVRDAEGHLMVVDHKTTKSTPTDEFLSKFARSFQLIGYVYGREKQLKEEIRKYMVNAAQKAVTIGLEKATLKACPDCRNGKKKKLSCETCNKTGKVEKLVKLEPFRRKPFTLDDSDVDRFVLWALNTVKRISEEKELFKTNPEESFPMNDQDCGRGPCPFIDACWHGRNVLKWHAPEPEDLMGLKPRGKDYVDDIASEEIR
jgi:hypothetical protein